MFAGNTHGQMHVTHDGTLIIQVRKLLFYFFPVKRVSMLKIVKAVS